MLETIPPEKSQEIRQAFERHIRDLERERDSQLFPENGDGA